MRLSYIKITVKTALALAVAFAGGGFCLFWGIGFIGAFYGASEDPIGYGVTCALFFAVSALVFWVGRRWLKSVRRCVRFYQILSDDYVRSVRHLADVLDRPVQEVGAQLDRMIRRGDLTGVHLDRNRDRILCLGDKKTYHL